MKKPLSPYLILTVVLAAIIVTLVLTAKTEDSCDTVKTILASVKVKPPEGRKYIGFDLNKHNLTFGTLTPGAMAKKTVSAEYTKNATAYVWAEGNISSWVIISPKRFELLSNTSQDVTFMLMVPVTAQEGEYDGKIVFCYQDKRKIFDEYQNPTSPSK